MRRQGMVWAAAAVFGIGTACVVANRKEVAPAGEGPKVSATGGKQPTNSGPATPASRWTTAVPPKPLGASTEKGLEWLVEHQQSDGGWAQGEEAQTMRGGEPLDRSNVADTCMSALALLRAGSTPAAGRHSTQLARAVAFVCGQIEAADADSLSVTSVNGTRVQMKIGTFVDTFAASMLLAEVKGQMDGDSGNACVDAALAKVLTKIARHQKQDGGWEGQGWAPILSQSLGSKGINRASQGGANVDARLLELAQARYAGPGDAVPASDSAGVELYAQAGSAGNAQDFLNTSFVKERTLREKLGAAKDEAEREQVRGELKTLEEGRAGFEAQQDVLVKRLDDQQFVNGFGSNGGEEFLSYMNISESLVVRADDAWRRWDESMATNLARVQNQDGSCSGHHCITGRTFCTSAALLVLLADRAPVPVEVVAARG